MLEQQPFRLYSAFWQNLHNLLWAAAWARRPASTSKPSRAGSQPKPLSGNLNSEERAAWEGAISYYDRELADRDLFFEMADSRKALIAVTGEVPKVGLTPEHRRALAAAAPVYRKYWWPVHDGANRAWVAETMRKVASLTPAVPDRLATLFGTPWFTSAVGRCGASHHSSGRLHIQRSRACTSLFPVARPS